MPITGLDIDAIRAETPGIEHVIHLHNSGASLMPQRVVDAVIDHIRLEAQIGGYEAAARAADRIEATYHALGQMLGCDASEIALTESATTAWNRCFLAMTESLGSGDRILTCRSEYASNYIVMMMLAERQGVSIDVVPDDEAGALDVGALRNMMDGRVGLIAVTHVPTSGAQVNPAAAIGAVAREANVPFLLDACQSAGQMPLDVNEINCDALSATGRKYLRGPRGTGFLYIKTARANTIVPPDLDLFGGHWSSDNGYTACDGARRFEYFEKNVAGQIGLGVAVDYANSLGLDKIYERIQFLAAHLRSGLAGIAGVTLTDIGAEQCGIVTFSHATHRPEFIAEGLRVEGINTGTSELASTRIDLASRGIDELVRMPVHYFNTIEEIDKTLATLSAL